MEVDIKKKGGHLISLKGKIFGDYFIK